MIAKTLLSTLVRKKARTLLLLFSIAACASLMFANAGFQRTCEQTVYEAATHWSGSADLYIAPKQAVGAEEWIDPGVLAPFGERLSHTYELLRFKALFAPDTTDMHYFTVLGTDIEEFNGYNPLALESGGTADWTGDKLIMGTLFAQRLGITVGDTLPLEIRGKSREFKIVGINRQNGLFLRDLADGGYLLMPKETAAEFLDGQCNLVFLKANDPSESPALRQELMDALPQYVVHFGIDHAVIRAETNGYVMPFWISSALVIFMSVFIIYSSFNLIVNERIGLIGILRSVGCTRRKANRILTVESILIGIVGSAIGCVLGVGILHVIKNLYTIGEMVLVEVPALFGVKEILFTIVSGTFITVISAMAPIRKLTKAPVKSIMLNDYQKQKIKYARLWPLGVLLIVPCFILPLLPIAGFMGMILGSAAAIIAMVGLNFLIPLLCRIATFISRGFSPEISLGVRNTGDFKALVNNVRLFATVMALMVFMMTLFNSMGIDLKNMYQRDQYDIEMELRESDPGSLVRLRETDGVAAVYGVYTTWSVINNYEGSYLNELIGMDDMEYFDFFPAPLPPEVLTALDALNDGRNIVTTLVMRDKLGLKIGDVMTLQLNNGAIDYRVTGFLDTNKDIGYMGFISPENFKADMGVKYYTKVYAKAGGNPAAVKSNIQRTLSRDLLTINTKGEVEAANVDKVSGIFNAINTYAYFAMLIGILGIINNMLACFLGRRRNLALYRCVGMSAKGTGRMLMAEAIVIGIIGTAAGLGTGIVMIRTVPLAVSMMWGNVAVVAPVMKIAVMCALGIATMVLCSLIPMFKGRNLSIMDHIRYE